MIRFNILLFLTFIVTATFAQDGYTLTGKVNRAQHNISIAYLYYPQQGGYVVDSCYISDNQFSFSGSVEYPTLATIELRNKNASLQDSPADVLNFYIENAPISINVGQIKANTTISGSHTQDLHLEFIQSLQPVREEMDNIRTAHNNATAEQHASQTFNDSLMLREQNVHKMNSEYVYQFVRKHPTDFISLYLLQSQLDNAPEDERILTMFSSLDETVRESGLGKEVAGRLQKIKATSLGSASPLFECTDIDGNPVRLSDFRGKFLLLMFWASDCSHCLAELPNIAKVFNLLAGEDFTILAVAVDPLDRKKQWEGFVKGNELPWTNVFDERIGGRKKITGLYNAYQIPSNFLLNKDGKIIAKNLYGEDLRQRLAIILQLSRKISENKPL